MSGRRLARACFRLVAATLVVGPTVILTVGLAAASAAPARPLAADETARTWGIQPATSSGVPTRPAFLYELNPGATIDDAVRITNFGTEPLDLRVSAHDAFNTAAGGFDVVPAATASTDVGRWITLDRDAVVVPARGYVDVPFHVAVPSNAAPGDHAGGIVASMSTTSADGSTVVVDHRVGTRVYARVTGPLHPSLVVTRFDLAHHAQGALGLDGALTAAYTVRNVGNIRLGAEQILRVGGPFGLGSTTVSTTVPELLPGSEYSGVVTLDDRRPLGRLSGTMTLTTPSAPPQVQSARASTWAVPWRLVAIGLVGGVVVVWSRRRTRRRPTRRAGETAKPADVPVGRLPSAALLIVVLGGLGPHGWSAATPTRDLRAVTTAGAADGVAAGQAVRLEPPDPALDGTVRVRLDGWPPGPAQVELCGNAGRLGSVDCDLLGAAAAEVRDDGTGAVVLPVAAPPRPCPCVVRVSQAASGATAVVPISIRGLPSLVDGGSDPKPPQPHLEVVAVDVRRDEGPVAQLGVDVGRQVVVTVRNTGAVRLDGLLVTATIDGPLSSAIVASPAPIRLEPGATDRVGLDFTLPAPALGTYRVAGRIDGTDDTVEFRASTRHTSWGLVGLGIVAVAAGVSVMLRRHAGAA